MLQEIDGVDAVLGLNFMSAHRVNVNCEDLSISIPTPDGNLVVKSAPQDPAFTQYSTENIEVVSGARLAKLLKREEGEVFLAYIKELEAGSKTPETLPPHSQQRMLHLK